MTTDTKPAARLLVGVLAWRHQPAARVPMPRGPGFRFLGTSDPLAILSDDGTRAVVVDAAGGRWAVPSGFLARGGVA